MEHQDSHREPSPYKEKTLLSPYKQEVFENSSFEAPCLNSDSKANPSNEMLLEELELSEKKSHISKGTPYSNSKRTPDAKPQSELIVITSENKSSASSIKKENDLRLLSEKKSEQKQKEESKHFLSPSMKQELNIHK